MTIEGAVGLLEFLGNKVPHLYDNGISELIY
jgi:hypothetical protein